MSLPKENRNFINRGTLHHQNDVKKTERRKRLTEGTKKTVISLSNMIAKITNSIDNYERAKPLSTLRSINEAVLAQINTRISRSLEKGLYSSL